MKPVFPYVKKDSYGNISPISGRSVFFWLRAMFLHRPKSRRWFLIHPERQQQTQEHSHQDKELSLSRCGSLRSISSVDS